MKKKSILISLILVFVGLLISLWLTHQHFEIYKKGFGEKSFCSINEYINCDVVNGSSYAEIGFLPLSVLGAIYYLTQLILLLRAYLSNADQETRLGLSVVMSFISIPFTLYTAGVSVLVLKAVCLMCVSLYIINLLTFFLIPHSTVKGWSSMITFIKNIFLSTRELLVQSSIGGIILVVGIILAWTMNPVSARPTGTDDLDTQIKKHFAQTPADVDYGNRPVWGNPNAKVKIIEFSDFQCPFCKMAAENLKPALAEYKDDVALYFANYPLDQSCNPYMQRPLHLSSCNAAKAAVCFAKQGGDFWTYHDILFNNQKSLFLDKLTDYATSHGAKQEDFTSCLYSEETNNTVRADIEAGQKLSVAGTPSIFVNGRRLSGWSNFKFLREVIKQELKGAK